SSLSIRPAMQQRSSERPDWLFPAGLPLQGANLAALVTPEVSLERLNPLVDHLRAWKRLPNVSQWVLHTVERGYRIQFGSPPPLFHGVLPTLVGPEQALAMEQEVNALLRKEAIEVVPPHHRVWVLQLVLHCSKEGWGVVSDLRSASAEPRSNASDGCVPHRLGSGHDGRHLTWHINCLELLAVFQALKHFLPDLRDHRVFVRTDNTSVVSYINHQGGLRSRPLYKLAHQILVWSQGKLHSLRAVYILGHLNQGADVLEWRLHPEVVELIWRVFGQAQVDLFATQETSHHPAPLGLDAMVQTWPRLCLSGESAPGRHLATASSPVLARLSMVLGPDFSPQRLSMGDSCQEESPLTSGWYDSAASKHTISRWIVDAVTLAYESSDLPSPLGVKAHSTRSMAVSKAFLSEVPLSDICNAAGWSTPLTFVRFYGLDIQATPGSSILSSKLEGFESLAAWTSRSPMRFRSSSSSQRGTSQVTERDAASHCHTFGIPAVLASLSLKLPAYSPHVLLCS
ncbi:hypothetical protein M9458_045474, partial [Cirrhinus mrigala]